MKTKRAAVAVAILLDLMVAAPVHAGEQPTLDRFLGVPVMPGGVIVDDRIVYGGGDVVVVPAVEVESFDSCPNGYVCLFANTNWQGTMVQLSSCCAWNNLSDYGFNDIASSWRNRMSVDAQIAKDPGGGGSRLCLNNGSYASSMPSGWDNSTSSIRVRDASTYC